MTETTTSRSVGRKVIRAGIAVGLAHVLFKVAGLLQAVGLAQLLPTRLYETVYVVGFEGCIFTLFLIGEEVIGPTFLPLFMGEKDKQGDAAAWSFTNSVLSIQLLILAGVTLLLMLAPGLAISRLTHWTPENAPEQFALARSSLATMAPALIFLSMGSTTYMILNGYKRFFLAAFGDAAWKLVVLASVVIGIGVFGSDIRALIYGIVGGSVAKLATHVFGLRGHVKKLRWSWNWRSPALKRMLVLMLPLIVGIIVAKWRDIFNNVTVLSALEEGLLRANSLGRKPYVTLGWLVPYSISIAMFPFLCELVDKGDRKGFGDLLSQSGRMVLSVFIPFSLFFATLSQPLAYFLFHQAGTGDQASTWIAVSMACYMLVFPAYALEYLLMQAFFAHRRMISVTVVGIAFSFVSIAISYVGVVKFELSGSWALAAVALGFTISRVLKSLVLVLLLRRSVDIFPPRETARFLLKALATSLPAAITCWLVSRTVGQHVPLGSPRLVSLAQLAAGGTVGLLTAVVVAYLVRLREPFEMARWALDAVARKRAGRSPAPR